MHPGPQAAPAPLLCALDQPGRDGITLDVAQQAEQMVVALDREALESSLIQVSVPDRPVCDAPAHGVRLRQPPKKVGHLTLLGRPDDEVPVVGEHTVRQNADGLPLVSLDHDALERFIIGFLAEQRHLAGGSVEDVINKATRCDSRGSWHGSNRISDRLVAGNTDRVPVSVSASLFLSRSWQY